VYRTQTAEITRLRARLEVRDDGGPDGILCRDESIRMQDAEIARLRAEVEALKAENARLHTANERMRAALERVRCRDWTPDWVRDIANRALEGGE
jgi:cell division protein FtsB